LAPWAQD